MAQIAGRAGRHQRDGTFGALAAEGPGAFTPEEVYAIEEHRFPALDFLYWREGEPDLVEHRRADRQPGGAARRRRCCAPRRRRSIWPCSSGWPRKIGCATARARPRWSRGYGRRAACPISASSAPTRIARFVARVFGHLSEGDGRLPASMVRERDCAARRRDRRCRDDRGADRGDTQLGLYRAPRRLARRSGALGGAHARGRGAAVRRAPCQR